MARRLACSLALLLLALGAAIAPNARAALDLCNAAPTHTGSGVIVGSNGNDVIRGCR